MCSSDLMADALASMKETRAAPLLASHLLDPMDNDDDIRRAGAAMAVLATPAEKKPLEAIKEMWKSDSLPDGPNGSCAHCLDFGLGRAYDLANQPDSAIAQLETFLATPWDNRLDQDWFSLAPTHKRLGELYDAKGDRDKAISHFSKFIELWKNADPELQPAVADAKRRLARLQAGTRS